MDLDHDGALLVDAGGRRSANGWSSAMWCTETCVIAPDPPPVLAYGSSKRNRAVRQNGVGMRERGGAVRQERGGDVRLVQSEPWNPLRGVGRVPGGHGSIVSGPGAFGRDRPSTWPIGWTSRPVDTMKASSAVGQCLHR